MSAPASAGQCNARAIRGSYWMAKLTNAYYLRLARRIQRPYDPGKRRTSALPSANERQEALGKLRRPGGGARCTVVVAAAGRMRHGAHPPGSAASRQPANAALARLRSCLSGHERLSATGPGQSFGRRTSAGSFNFGAVAVSGCPTVAAAKSSIAPQPSLGSQIRTGAVVAEFGDALRGGEFRGAAQVRACALKTQR